MTLTQRCVNETWTRKGKTYIIHIYIYRYIHMKQLHLIKLDKLAQHLTDAKSQKESPVFQPSAIGVLGLLGGVKLLICWWQPEIRQENHLGCIINPGEILGSFLPFPQLASENQISDELTGFLVATTTSSNYRSTRWAGHNSSYKWSELSFLCP